MYIYSYTITKQGENLFNDIQRLIEEARSVVSQTVNTGVTLLYWKIGERINSEVLKNKRAEYGKEIVVTLSRQLTEEYGNNFNEKNLRRMVQFSKEFSDFEIVVTLSRQLSWSHFIAIIPLKTDLEREFYAQMCRVERWNVRTLRRKIQSMLFERTAISQKPEELAKLELEALQKEDQITPDLVFQISGVEEPI